MKAGNISQTVWKRSVQKQLNSVREEVLLSPSMEEHCTVYSISEEGKAIQASASVSGDSAEIGIFAVLKALNDLISRGGKPIGVSAQVILPLSASEAHLKAMVGCMESMCREAEVQLTCLKAESNPAVTQSIVTVTAVGEVRRDEMVLASGAVPGQDIVLCGYIGLEGTLRILAEQEEELSRRFVPAFIRQIKEFKMNLLCRGALIAAGKAGISAILQIGSGGIFAALWELAEASGIGMEVDMGRMSVRQETVEICEYYHLNPYQLTSAGSFLLTADDGDALTNALNEVGARAIKLGVATDGNARVITSGEEQRYLDRPAPDELMLWWERKLRNN